MVLVVEDGTGLETAESYISVAAANTYLIARYGAGNAFTATSSLDDQEAALRVGTDDLGNLYGSMWKGLRINATMALDWPRTGVEDEDGYAVESTSVPALIERATAELALRVRQDPTGTASSGLIPDDADASQTIRKRVRAGPVEVEKYFESGAEQGDRYPRVTAMVTPLLKSGSRITLS